MQLEKHVGVSQPPGVMDCDGLCKRICLVVRWAMLGAQSHMGDAQHQVALCDMQMSHQSDKCEWQQVAVSEEGVTTTLRR